MANNTKLLARCKYFMLGVLALVLLNLCVIYSVTINIGERNLNKNAEVKVKKAKEPEPKGRNFGNTTLDATRKIFDRLNGPRSFFLNWKSSAHKLDFNSLLMTKNLSRFVQLWNVAAQWVTKDQITPQLTPLLYNVIKSLEKTQITKAEITPKGTQLKILLTLEGGQRALFKPKWYGRDTVIYGSVYSGKDRHNGEIAAFHLSRLLGLNRAPIVTRRVVNLNSEILPVASFELNQTVYFEGGNTCFFGVCLYCKREDGICADGALLEGSVTLWLPEKWTLKRARHPWQRSYSNHPATWEVLGDFCQVIKGGKLYKDESKLLDLIDTAVFDFLIDNGDRHHYEYFSIENSKVLLIDNAKSFGNPNVDHVDILAPLYQCCRIRSSLLSVLVQLQGGSLSVWLKRVINMAMTASEVLSEEHFLAMNRRLEKVLAAVEVCIEEKGIDFVIVRD